MKNYSEFITRMNQLGLNGYLDMIMYTNDRKIGNVNQTLLQAINKTRGDNRKDKYFTISLGKKSDKTRGSYNWIKIGYGKVSGVNGMVSLYFYDKYKNKYRDMIGISFNPANFAIGKMIQERSPKYTNVASTFYW